MYTLDFPTANLTKNVTLSAISAFATISIYEKYSECGYLEHANNPALMFCVGLKRRVCPQL